MTGAGQLVTKLANARPNCLSPAGAAGMANPDDGFQGRWRGSAAGRKASNPGRPALIGAVERQHKHQARWLGGMQRKQAFQLFV